MSSLRGLFKPPAPNAPQLEGLTPSAAMPGGEFAVKGRHLGSAANRPPTATLGDSPALLTLSRPTRATVQVPVGATPGELVIHANGIAGNPLHARIAVPMAEGLHPVANPAVDAEGRLFTTLSGARGQRLPVSVFSIDREFQVRPFVRGLLNPTGLAFDPSGRLYVSSRADGSIYRVTASGSVSTFAEGLGIPTGIAFDADGNLYVGDRSGTIFKIAAQPSTPSLVDAMADPADTFVFATLEPSMAAYHLAFNATGTLFVTAPTTSSNQAIHAIAPDGTISTYFRGLGRAQGIAFDVDDNLYVAASLNGQCGIVKITPSREATMAVSGPNLVGLAFLDDGCAALAARDAIYHIDLGIQGRKLV